MDEVFMQIRQAEQMIEDVSPLLVIDDWERAREKVSQFFEKMTGLLQLLIQHQNELVNIDIQQIFPVLERMIYAIQVGDTIQLADILIYEMNRIFQNIHEQYGNA